MARVFDGSTQYLSAASTLLTNEPIDMVCFGNTDSDTAVQRLIGLGDGAATSGLFSLGFQGNIAGDPIRGQKINDAAAQANADTSVSFTINTWYVASCSFISDTSRSSFNNGGSKGSDATNISDPTPNFISVGAAVRSVVNLFFDGSLAEAYVLDANMTDAQHGAAGKGISPFWLVPGKNVRARYPLQGHNNNRVRNGYPDLTATGSPTNGIHPARVLRPRFNGVMAV